MDSSLIRTDPVIRLFISIWNFFKSFHNNRTEDDSFDELEYSDVDLVQIAKNEIEKKLKERVSVKKGFL